MAEQKEKRRFEVQERQKEAVYKHHPNLHYMHPADAECFVEA